MVRVKIMWELERARGTELRFNEKASQYLYLVTSNTDLGHNGVKNRPKFVLIVFLIRFNSIRSRKIGYSGEEKSFIINFSDTLRNEHWKVNHFGISAAARPDDPLSILLG